MLPSAWRSLNLYWATSSSSRYDCSCRSFKFYTKARNSLFSSLTRSALSRHCCRSSLTFLNSYLARAYSYLDLRSSSLAELLVFSKVCLSVVKFFYRFCWESLSLSTSRCSCSFSNLRLVICVPNFLKMISRQCVITSEKTSLILSWTCALVVRSLSIADSTSSAMICLYTVSMASFSVSQRPYSMAQQLWHFCLQRASYSLRSLR